MKTKETKNNDGWELYSAETTCDVTGTKISGSESYSKKRWFKGSPSEVKALIQMQFDGYNYEITNIHTIEKYRRHDLTATNHGTVKNYEEKILQFDSFGSDEPVVNRANLNQQYQANEPKQDGKYQWNDKNSSENDNKTWTKNIIDKLIDANANTKNWLIILGAFAFAGLGISVFVLAKILFG